MGKLFRAVRLIGLLILVFPGCATLAQLPLPDASHPAKSTEAIRADEAGCRKLAEETAYAGRLGAEADAAYRSVLVILSLTPVVGPLLWTLNDKIIEDKQKRDKVVAAAYREAYGKCMEQRGYAVTWPPDLFDPPPQEFPAQPSEVEIGR